MSIHEALEESIARSKRNKRVGRMAFLLLFALFVLAVALIIALLRPGKAEASTLLPPAPVRALAGQLEGKNNPSSTCTLQPNGSWGDPNFIDRPCVFNPSNSFVEAKVGPRKEIPRQKPKVTASVTKQVTVTAYAPGDGSGSYAADGTRTYFGMLACPYSMKFGTKVQIKSLYGDKVFKCHDRSATTEGLIDIWVPTLKEAFKVGRRFIQVTVLK